MGEGEIEFLRTSYREYYYRSSGSLWVPPRLESREIGFLTFDGHFRRHLRVGSRGELVSAVLREVPWGIFYSVSLYEDPGNPEMDRKGWMGADLAFDIDVKDLHPACIDEHDFYLCEGGEVRPLGAGASPGCRRVDWVCPNCVEAGRREVLKLLDVLQRDLGIRPDAISVYFSGHRGFHVHVEDDSLLGLGREARAQIVDYLTLSSHSPGFLLELLGNSEDDLRTLVGWPMRVAEALRRRYGAPPTRAFLEHVTRGEAAAALEAAIAEVRVRVDPQVTMDVSRILRMPTSLNEKTGMAKVPCRDVVVCDPLEEAVAIGDEPVRVEISYAPRLRIGGYDYGPYRHTTLRLPAFVSAFLISKGVAKLVK
nr:DNA primase, small subunit [uncultured archaeon]